MTDRETPLAKIDGQMLLSKNTDVLTQSWVFVSVNDDLTYIITLIIVYTDEDPGWVETTVFFDNDICPTSLSSGVFLSVIRTLPLVFFALIMSSLGF